MATEQLAALCEAAKKRLQKFINQSAAQHLRAIRKSYEPLGKL